MSQELCEGYKHKIIYRIVQKHSDKDLTKYLFVGAGLEKKVQKILNVHQLKVIVIITNIVIISIKQEKKNKYFTTT